MLRIHSQKKVHILRIKRDVYCRRRPEAVRSYFSIRSKVFPATLLGRAPQSWNRQGRGPAWSNSLFEDNAEFGFGMRIAVDRLAQYARELLQELKSAVGSKLVRAILSTTQAEATSIDDQRCHVAELRSRLIGSSAELEARYLELICELRRQVEIPITVKLPSQFTAILQFVKQLEIAGADWVALFNRFYQPDIELETLQVEFQLHPATSADVLLAVRWIAILFGRVELSLAATGGIHSAGDVLKMLLAGADVTHLCSALITHGPQRLAQIKSEMEAWMEERGFNSITELKGHVSQQHAADPAAFSTCGKKIWPSCVQASMIATASRAMPCLGNPSTLAL